MIIFDGTYRWPDPGRKKREPITRWPYSAHIRIIDLSANSMDLPRIRPITVVAATARPLAEGTCAEARGLAICRDFDLDYRQLLWVEYASQDPEKLFVADFTIDSFSNIQPIYSVSWRPATPNEHAAIQTFIPEIKALPSRNTSSPD